MKNRGCITTAPVTCHFLTRHFIALSLGLLLLCETSFAVTPPPSGVVEIRAERLSDYSANPEIATMRSIPPGGTLRVSGVNLDQAETTDLVLERFTVFAPDAQIMVDGTGLIAAPTDAYFRGFTTTMPQALVVLTVPEHGAVRGLITDSGKWWIIGDASSKSGFDLPNRQVDMKAESAKRPFRCETDKLPRYDDLLPETSIPSDKLAANVKYTAKIAIETDYEYFAKFGNNTAALQYMADLIAFASTVYEREINTNLVISYSELWPNGANSDPWPTTNHSNVMLAELRNYWNTNRTNIDRTITHFLSGQETEGGLASVGVLCDSPIDGSGYGFTCCMKLLGVFDINNPDSSIWDIIAMTHELGHNFGSLHTQGYCGILDVNDPVDLCVAGEDTCQGILHRAIIFDLT